MTFRPSCWLSHLCWLELSVAFWSFPWVVVAHRLSKHEDLGFLVVNPHSPIFFSLPFAIPRRRIKRVPLKHLIWYWTPVLIENQENTLWLEAISSSRKEFHCVECRVQSDNSNKKTDWLLVGLLLFLNSLQTWYSFIACTLRGPFLLPIP